MAVQHGARSFFESFLERLEWQSFLGFSFPSPRSRVVGLDFYNKRDPTPSIFIFLFFPAVLFLMLDLPPLPPQHEFDN